MKLNELKKLGVNLDANSINVDIISALIDVEFPKKGTTDYRTRVIDKVTKLKVPWVSEQNTIMTSIMRFLDIKCPYCSTVMTTNGGNENSDFCVVYKQCPSCGSVLTIKMPSDGFGVLPPIKGFEKAS